MMPVIVTRNIYLETAVTHLFQNELESRGICIIHFDGQTSLRELLSFLCEGAVKTSQKLIFTGNPGIYSLHLKKYCWVDDNISVKQFSEQIYKAKGVSVQTLAKDISEYLSLSDLTILQFNVAMLSKRYQVHTIANILDLSDQAIYNLVGKILAKKKLSSLKQLRFFLIKEFSS